MSRVLCCCCCFVVAMLFYWSSAAVQSPPSPIDCADIKQRLDRAEERLKDWPNLGRYREANRQLPYPASGENRVVFLGDSITDMWDDAGSGGFFPGKPYINRGISGQTTPQMLIRFHSDVVELQPKVVVLLAGTDDIAGNTGPTTLEAIENNLASMWEMAEEHGIRVVVASLLPVSNHETDRDGKPINQTNWRLPEQIIKLNDWIKYNAPKHGHIYLDYFSAVVDAKGFLKDELSGDGLNVNAKGYAVMGPLAERAIRLALKAKR
jgi:lysophospholipase L1-like esterase